MGRHLRQERARVALPFAVFFLALAVYVAALAPAVYWLDSSELAAAAWGLGVAHPPGHPLALLFGKAAALLPLGSIAFKVGLASALAGAGAATQTARLAREVSRRTRGGEATLAVDELLGAAAGLGFAFSYAAAFQAVRPEVYALNALLVTSAAVELAAFDERPDRRKLYAAALATGLALTNHSLLALAFTAAALPFALLRSPRAHAVGAAARVGIAGALGAVPLVYLPLRALRHPLVDWGAPFTAARAFWTVSAQAFQKSLERGHAVDAAQVVWALAAELHVGALFAVSGAYVLLRSPGRRRLGLFLVAAALFDALAPARVGFDVANPDAFGYLAPAVALLFACGAALPASVAVHRPRIALASAGALMAGALLLGASRFSRFSLARVHDADRVLAGFLDGAPPRATLVTSYFQTLFGLWYVREAEGRRPDVELVHRHFLAYPGYRDELLRRAPALAPLLGPRDVDAEAVAADPGALIEYDLDLAPALAARARTVPATGGSNEPQARRFAAWQAFLEAHRACRTQEPAAAERALAAARTQLGGDPELAELSRQCAKLRSPTHP